MKKTTENRKALPKFSLIVLGAMFIGILSGFVISGMQATSIAEQTWFQALSSNGGWILIVMNLLSAVIQFTLYGSVSKQFRTWQEEDEAGLRSMDQKLTLALTVNGVFLILSYGFISIPFGQLSRLSLMQLLLCLCGLVLSMVVMVVGQQKLVDLTKKLYPEKQGSIYDPKFQKIWYQSCDEAERAQIGQASYFSYKATNTACLALWLLCLLGQQALDFGCGPCLAVSVIWLVSTLSYSIGCMKYQ